MSFLVVPLLQMSASKKIGEDINLTDNPVQGSRKLLMGVKPGNVSYGQLSSGPTPSTPPTSPSWPNDWIASGPYGSPLPAFESFQSFWTADGGTFDLGAFTADCYDAIFGPGYTFATAPFSIRGTNASWPFSDFGGAIGNGWFYNGSTTPAANCNLAMAKNNESFILPYFIAEIQSGYGWTNVGDNPVVNVGTSYISTIVTILSQGFIEPGLVIGTGQDIDLPFPTTTPGQALGNTIMGADLIVPVIGLNVGVWLRAMGQKLGTSHGTTS
jgi:hypothetical protein